MAKTIQATAAIKGKAAKKFIQKADRATYNPKKADMYKDAPAILEDIQRRLKDTRP